MCGIFGLLLRAGARIDHGRATATLAKLYRGSESRGKESSGLHAYLPHDGRAWTLKGSQRASELLASRQYRKLVDIELKEVFGDAGGFAREPLALLAHSRLVTNGTAELAQNNQPVRWGPVTMIHNGIVVNVDELWARNPHLARGAEVDTEVLAALAADRITQGDGPIEAMREAYGSLTGAASIAWMHEQGGWACLATNTGDLYTFHEEESGFLIFASERHILREALKELLAELGRTADAIQWIAPGTGLVVDLESLSVERFALIAQVAGEETRGLGREKLALAQRPARRQEEVVASKASAPIGISRQADYSLLRYSEQRVRELRRCTKCVLPETFPFISFDAQGVCSYCLSYKPRYKNLEPTKAKGDFIASLQHYRRSDGSPDTIVAFSGGRDSSYGLHLIKKEFGLNPITFTYDWGMVTDLARRNVARICGQLGVQNILVSADIRQKRDNIRKNVSAWLHNPDLGLIPLFMAGDKHFFRVVNELKRQTGIRLDLWCANPLENTDFKSGFCGVAPDFEKKRVDYLSLGRKARMAAYYAGHFLKNPRYINGSIPDTIGAFMAYYVEPRRDFFFIFDHFVWNEDEVNKTLLGEYDWELAPDTPSTWRIGDGTAPFYNYVYMTARGFSEFDTFRSNQIREGMITRDFALDSIMVENRPRAESIRWYLDTIGLDFDTSIRRVNELDTLGLHR